MLRKLLGAGVLLATLAGCTKLEGRTCTADTDCGQGGRCDTSVGLCYGVMETQDCTSPCKAYAVYRADDSGSRQQCRAPRRAGAGVCPAPGG
jgi:hypothetical protein